MGTTEHTINDAISEILRETRRAWQEEGVLSAERTSSLKGSSARPDILLTEPSVSPVVIETEVSPAASVEREARERLGLQLRSTGRPILSAVAMRLPDRLRFRQGKALRQEVEEATDLEMALYTGSDSTSNSRWPRSGWLTGGIRDLSFLAQSATIPPDIIEIAADHLVSGISEAAGILAEVAASRPGVSKKISERLHQEDSEQTRRIAATILANACLFQESLAGGPGG